LINDYLSAFSVARKICVYLRLSAVNENDYYLSFVVLRAFVVNNKPCSPVFIGV